MKMHKLPRLIWRVLAYAAAIAALATASFAQITTTGIRGIVRDPNGAVITSATIKVVDNATGIEQTAVSSSDGGFLFPSLQSGTYKLTATAAGFQSTVIGSVTVESGRTTNVSLDLEIGTTAETVLVTASSEQLNTTTAEVGGTISNKLVQNLPYAGRDSLNFAVLIAGNARSTSERNSTFNGLPNASLNITLDGMNNNSQRFKSGGTSFFAFAPARIDAIEEVSVSTTGLGADAGGEGAMQIRLTTKRGSDHYHGQLLEQFQNDALNANSFFRNLQGLPRLKTRQNNVVGSIGGPLLPFIPRLKKKVFFFVYYETQPQPVSQTFQTAVLSPAAQLGNFSYIGTDNVKRSVNLLQAAGAAGFTNTVDPTIAGILGTINGTQSQASGFVDIAGIAPEFERNMQWNQATKTTQAFPTVRVDFQITPNVAWHGTWNLRHSDFGGGPPYPGGKFDFQGTNDAGTVINHSKITTYVATNAVDWAIKPNIINNISFGIQSNGEYFFPGAEPQRFAAYGNRIINTPLIAAYIPNVATDVRNNPVYQFTDNMSWVKGRHTMTLGGTFLHTTFYSHTYGTAGVPQFNFGVATNDPVNSVLRNVLPNINTNNNDVNNALNLYALLTGRLTSITVNTNLDEKTKKYVPFGELMVRYAFTTAGVYAQDSFRFRPDLTLNFGLRWQFDGAIHSGNDIQSEPAGDNFFGPSTGLFQPGVLSSNQNPAFVQVTNPYKRDFLNPAPNLGFAWNPAGNKEGFLDKLLGERKTVIRGAYSITFYNEGLNSISNSLGGGRGTTQAGAATNGVQFPTGSLNLRSPVPAIPVFPPTFSLPILESAYTFSASGFNGNYINPNLRSPYVQNWSLGIQRQLTNKTIVELRYVGNKATHMWHRQDLQETNIFENGFLPQFIQAKKNLDINIASGRGNTFINNNLAGQAGIPIFEAAFGALGSQPAVANGSGFGSAAFITNLNQGVAGGLANTLATNTAYYCRLVGSNFSPCANIGFGAAGKYPLNIFRSNPFLNGMQYQDSNGDNNYNALQIEVRQQFSHGLLLNANYTLAHSLGDLLNETDQASGYQWFTNRSARLNYGPSPFDRRHVFNSYWTYDLPFGKGRRFLGNNAVLDRVVGGWTLGGRQTIASGNPFLLNGGRNTVNNLSQGGVVFGSGLTPEQLQKALSTVVGGFSSTALISNVGSLRTTTGAADPTRYAPGSTPGQYAGFIYLRNNNFYTFDMSINKVVRINERWRMNVRAVALNFLNHPFFDIGNSSPTSTQFGQITTGSGTRTVQLRASLDW